MEQDSSYLGRKAAADLSSSQYLAVKLDSSGNVALATAATDVIAGTVQNKPVANDTANVKLRSCNGTLKIKAGGTLAINDAVTSNASSLGIATTTAGNQIIGYATKAAVSGDIVELMPSTAKY